MADDLHVSGNLSDVGNDTLIAMTYLNNSVDQTMKVVGKDGAFDFHMDVKEPAPLVLQVRHPLRPAPPGRTRCPGQIPCPDRTAP